MATAATALIENRLEDAGRFLRQILETRPDQTTAMHMLAELHMRQGRDDEAEALLVRVLELRPNFTAARQSYAHVLHGQYKLAKALAQAERLLADDPDNLGLRKLRVGALTLLGDPAPAAALYESLLAADPDQPLTWLSLGHALRALGRLSEAVAAYRKSLELAPSLGEAFWSLANLKMVSFSEAEVAAMRTLLAQADLPDESRVHLHFALGKALEDAADYHAAFDQYSRANAIRRRRIEYDPDELTQHVRRSKAQLTAGFFAERVGQGCAAADPIFVVGMPRAGSTLIEQILASHSQVEGTQELPEIPALAYRIGGKGETLRDSRYPEVLAALSAEERQALGEEYLERTRAYRRLGRPLFIDKMPSNFAHIGLIHLILPNAKIIDARRHPLGCCVSGFKQNFAHGYAFTYQLADLGRCYADYVELMAHFDAVLPGRVHRVIYEEMVAEPETQIRALLDHCGLPFEAACLRFWETERVVRTASSEQVRRPLFMEAVEHWRNYDVWLAPLKAALGPVLATYPQAPSY